MVQNFVRISISLVHVSCSRRLNVIYLASLTLLHTQDHYEASHYVTPIIGVLLRNFWMSLLPQQFVLIHIQYSTIY
jgi:hypothetical protein